MVCHTTIANYWRFQNYLKANRAYARTALKLPAKNRKTACVNGGRSQRLAASESVQRHDGADAFAAIRLACERIPPAQPTRRSCAGDLLSIKRHYQLRLVHGSE